MKSIEMKNKNKNRIEANNDKSYAKIKKKY